MSSQDPGTGPQPDPQDIAVPEARKPGLTRKYIAAFAAAGVAVAAAGTAVWAWQSFMSQGAQPAQALPANTLAYAALDLDPPGGQKLAAYNALRQFPSIKRELGLNSVDDVQKSLVDEVASDGGCDLDYATVKPWLGDRLAVAVVPQPKPEGVLVLQVSDPEKARTGLKAVSSECHFGFALNGDWAILAKNDAVATQVSKDASASNLDDRKVFQNLTDSAGDPGLVTLYAAPEAGQALLDVIDDNPFTGMFMLIALNGALDPVTSFVTSFGLFSVASGDFASGEDEAYEEPALTPQQKKEQQEIQAQFEHFEELTDAQQKAVIDRDRKLMEEIYGLPDSSEFSEDSESFDEEAEGFDEPEVDPTLRASLKEFTGLGGVGRFADGGLEVEIVGDELNGTSADMYAGNDSGDRLSDLPDDTAIAFGAGFADDWVDLLFGHLTTGYGFGGSTKAETITSFEKSTGLDVPADLEALGGDGVTFVAGSGISFDKLFEDPARTPVAALITGDADKIEAALDKLRTHRGDDATKLLSQRIGDDVAISANADYLADLKKAGNLGDTEAFRKVLPDADDATTVFFMNFDAGDWLATSAGSERADAEPLDSLGMSVTKKDGEQHVVLRVRFDD